MADNKPGPLTELYKIFRIVDRGDILDNTVGTKDYNDISSSPQLKLFVNKVMGNLSNGRGLPSLAEISEFHSSRLKDSSERNLPISFFSISNDSSSPQNSNLGISEKKSQVSRYFSPGLVKSLFSIKGVESDVTKQNPIITSMSEAPVENGEVKIGVVEVITPYISLNTKNTSLSSLFLTSVPSMEFSKCQPFMEINFENYIPGGNTGEALGNVPTIALQILGPSEIAGDKYAQTYVKEFAPGVITDEASKLGGNKFIETNMDTFLMPQSMLSNESSQSGRYNKVFDKFRPLVGLKKMDISVASARAGAIGYKTARLELTVFDRARLREVARIIDPAAYSHTYVRISYGWRHPEPNTPYGALINSMQVVGERYNIKGTNFSFTQNGTVDVTVELAARGAFEVERIKIIDGGTADYFRRLEDLRKEIGKLLIAVRGDKDSGTPEVRAYEVIDTIADRAEFPGEDTKKELDKALAYLSALKASYSKNKNSNTGDFQKNVSELGDRIAKFGAEYTGKPQVYSGKIYVPSKLNTTNDKRSIPTTLLEQTTAKYMSKLTSPYFPDPFIDFEAPYAKNTNIAYGAIKESVDQYKFHFNPSDFKQSLQKNLPKKKIASFASVLLTFCGESLKRSGFGKEVQFFFYPFNDEAGYAAGTSIASFPCDLEYLQQSISRELKAQGSNNMTVNQFMTFLINVCIADSAAYGYGLREGYKIDPKDATKREVNDKTSGGLTQYEQVKARLSSNTKTSFRMPGVEYYIESQDSKDGADGIVRIHVFDKQASSYTNAREASELQNTLRGKLENSKKSLAEIENTKRSINSVPQNVSKEEKYVNGFINNFEALKRIMTNSIPIIEFGTQTSAIVDGSFKSQSDKLAATVNMMRANSSSGDESINASQRGGMPFFVQPAQMSMTTMGCPLLSYAQQFFVDFGTGTTIDNTYGIKSISHSIEKGKFMSSIELTPIDSYGVYRDIRNQLDEILKINEKIANADAQLKSDLSKYY